MFQFLNCSLKFVGLSSEQMLRSWSDSQATGFTELRQSLLQYIVLEHKRYYQQTTSNLPKASDHSNAALAAIQLAVKSAAEKVASTSFFPTDVDDEHRSTGVLVSADGVEHGVGSSGNDKGDYVCFFDSHDRHFNSFCPPSIYDTPSGQQQQAQKQPATLEEWSVYYADMASESTKTLLRELERACYEAGAALCTLGPVLSEGEGDFNDWLRWALRAEHRRVPMLKGSGTTII